MVHSHVFIDFFLFVVLSQVKSFLPQLAEANTNLDDITNCTEDGKERVNIEYVSDEEKEHIEMVSYNTLSGTLIREYE